MDEKFASFLSNYFGADYDDKGSEKWKDVFKQIEMYYADETVGGWSSLYCKKTWNDETLKNDVDLEIFDILLKIDIKNGADTFKIVHCLCSYGAFDAVKVRKI